MIYFLTNILKGFFLPTNFSYFIPYDKLVSTFFKIAFLYVPIIILGLFCVLYLLTYFYRSNKKENKSPRVSEENPKAEGNPSGNLVTYTKEQLLSQRLPNLNQKPLNPIVSLQDIPQQDIPRQLLLSQQLPSNVPSEQYVPSEYQVPQEVPQNPYLSPQHLKLNQYLHVNELVRMGFGFQKIDPFVLNYLTQFQVQYDQSLGLLFHPDYQGKIFKYSRKLQRNIQLVRNPFTGLLAPTQMFMNVYDQNDQSKILLVLVWCVYEKEFVVVTDFMRKNL